MKKSRWMAVAAVIVAFVTGCVSGTAEEEKIKDIRYEIIKRTKIPADLQQEIQKELQKKETSGMWLSYGDTGEKEKGTYIVRGYGTQETTGYSIEVNACYETEHNIVIRTTLLGPGKREKTHKRQTYPYIVIKIPYTEKQIIYE